MSAPVRFVTVERFGDFSGYTPDAVRSKIKRGDWLEGAVWVKAPDGTQGLGDDRTYVRALDTVS